MTKQLIRFGTAVMTALLALVIVWQFRIVVVYLLVSLAFAATLRPLAKHWAGRRLPLRLALILLYLAVLGGAGLLLYLVSRSALGEIQSMAHSASAQGQWLLPRWLENSPFQKALVGRLPSPNTLIQAVTGDQGQRVLPTLLGVTQGIGSLVSAAIVILLLSLYWTTSQTHFERLWLSLLPPGQRKQVRDTWRTIELDLGAYIRSQLALCVLTGVLLGLGYWVLGSPYPTLLGLIGGLVCLIPVVGAPLALLPPLLVGLLTGVQTGLITVLYTVVVLASVAIWVRPRLFRRERDNPILTVVILIAMADAFGLVGLIIAPPLSAVCQILWSSLVSRRVVSGSAVQVSDLKEREAQLWATLKGMERPPGPLVTSSMERLTGLLEKAQPVLQAALPAEGGEAFLSPQPIPGERVPSGSVDQGRP